MTDWNEIAGRGFTPHGFAACVEGIPFGAWRPQSVILHSTNAASERDRVKNLRNFRASRAQRPSGFRVLVTHDLVWILNVPAGQGAPGEVEVIGDFDTEPGAMRVRENVSAVLVAMYGKAGLRASDIRLAKEPRKVERIPDRELNVPVCLPHADSRPLTMTCSV